MQFFTDFFANQMIVAALLGWFIAQLLKVIFVLLREKKFDLRRMIGSGGMPSSHASLVTSLATAVGYHAGVNSVEFAICFVLALVVMYDASGVRRETGRQAEIINDLMENFGKENMEITGERLKELVGHTPLEVFAGAALGVLVGIMVCNF